MALNVQNIAIPDNYRRTFSNNWEHTIQQVKALLAQRVTVDDYEGKQKVYTDINQVAFNRRTQRLGRTNPKQVSSNQRVSNKFQFSCPIIFDRSDKEFLGQLMEPDSELLVEMRYAWNRQLDQLLLAAATGTVYGGVDPYVTPIVLNSGQQIAVNFVTVGSQVNTGMTPDKLMRVSKLFEDNFLDPYTEEVYITMRPKQKENLAQVIKTAPNAPYANMIGDWLNDPTKKLFGMTAIINPLLTVTSGVATCVAWTKRGIYATADAMDIEIDKRADLEHAKQIVAYGDAGFMRRYEERVVTIACDETV